MQTYSDSFLQMPVLPNVVKKKYKLLGRARSSRPFLFVFASSSLSAQAKGEGGQERGLSALRVGDRRGRQSSSTIKPGLSTRLVLRTAGLPRPLRLAPLAQGPRNDRGRGKVGLPGLLQWQYAIRHYYCPT